MAICKIQKNSLSDAQNLIAFQKAFKIFVDITDKSIIDISPWRFFRVDGPNIPEGDEEIIVTFKINQHGITKLEWTRQPM